LVVTTYAAINRLRGYRSYRCQVTSAFDAWRAGGAAHVSGGTSWTTTDTPEFLLLLAKRSEFLDEGRADVISKRWKEIGRRDPSTRSLVGSSSSTLARLLTSSRHIGGNSDTPVARSGHPRPARDIKHGRDRSVG
jgi:hypothetical protein